jgi:amino acid permease
MLFGVLVAFLVIIRTLLGTLILDFVPSSSWLNSRTTFVTAPKMTSSYLAGVFALVCITPLALLRKISALRFTSIGSLMAVGYVVILIIGMPILNEL